MLGPCPVCSRADPREEDWCDYCQADYPDAWAAHQGLVASPLTADEQARTDEAVRIALTEAFWPPFEYGPLAGAQE